jgi:hypothetical protein
MEMPYYLKTLPPEALEIIRFYSGLGDQLAYTDDIMAKTGLSDRGFGKAIRRLVTKGFLVMDGEQRYRLSERGARAVEELAAADSGAPAATDDDDSEMMQIIKRRLVMIVPQPMIAGQSADVIVGFNDADAGESLAQPVDLLMRLNIVNGEPQHAIETPLALHNDAAQQVFSVTAGGYTQVRLRLQVFQIGSDLEDVQSSGGMYVDVDVQPGISVPDTTLTAFGSDAHMRIAE